jgi:hypothetical protein
MMPSTAATSFFCVACRATHHRPRLPADARGARFCGSFPGGWLVAELPWPRGHYALLNLLTGARVPLPRLLAVPCHGGGKMCLVVLQAVTLSAAPSVEPGPGEPYYAAAIVAGQSNIASWTPGARAPRTAGFHRSSRRTPATNRGTISYPRTGSRT